MTNQINANLDDLTTLKQVTTLDGRTITINSFTVEPETPPAIDLSTATVGDRFVTFEGQELELISFRNSPHGPRYPYSFREPIHGNTWTYTKDGVHNIGSGCNGRNLKRLVKKAQPPGLSLEGAKMGDSLRLRNGDVALITSVDNFYPLTGYVYCPGFGWFLKNGQPTLGAKGLQDAVELIPAPKKPLQRRIIERIRELGAGKVDHVTVNTDDWYELSQGPTRISIEGYTLCGSSSVPKGAYRIQLFFED